MIGRDALLRFSLAALVTGGWSLAQNRSSAALEPYSIYDDDIHNQWHQLSTSSTGAIQPDEQTLGYRFIGGYLTLAGYTYSRGADDVKVVLDACHEHQGAEVVSGGDCVKASLRLFVGYSVAVIIGFFPDHAVVAIQKMSQSIGIVLSGNQGQGPNTKKTRASIEKLIAPPFHYSYGDGNQSDYTIDAINHAIDVGYGQKLRLLNGDSTKFHRYDRRRTLGKRDCQGDEEDISQNGHYWQWDGNNGLKMQCKNGCGVSSNADTAHDSMVLSNALADNFVQSGDLNTQFTLYENDGGRVWMRCKATFETVIPDYCPEPVDGQGCNF